MVVAVEEEGGGRGRGCGQDEGAGRARARRRGAPAEPASVGTRAGLTSRPLELDGVTTTRRTSVDRAQADRQCCRTVELQSRRPPALASRRGARHERLLLSTQPIRSVVPPRSPRQDGVECRRVARSTTTTNDPSPMSGTMLASSSNAIRRLVRPIGWTRRLQSSVPLTSSAAAAASTTTTSSPHASSSSSPDASAAGTPASPSPPAPAAGPEQHAPVKKLTYAEQDALIRERLLERDGGQSGVSTENGEWNGLATNVKNNMVRVPFRLVRSGRGGELTWTTRRSDHSSASSRGRPASARRGTACGRPVRPTPPLLRQRPSSSRPSSSPSAHRSKAWPASPPCPGRPRSSSLYGALAARSQPTKRPRRARTPVSRAHRLHTRSLHPLLLVVLSARACQRYHDRLPPPSHPAARLASLPSEHPSRAAPRAGAPLANDCRRALPFARPSNQTTEHKHTHGAQGRRGDNTHRPHGSDAGIGRVVVVLRGGGEEVGTRRSSRSRSECERGAVRGGRVQSGERPRGREDGGGFLPCQQKKGVGRVRPPRSCEVGRAWWGVWSGVQRGRVVRERVGGTAGICA